MAKLLIDECLHTSLLKLAHEAGHTADHVNYLGLGSSKDHEPFSLPGDDVWERRCFQLGIYRWISKVLLLAQDDKIKDPTVLEQLR